MRRPVDVGPLIVRYMRCCRRWESKPVVAGRPNADDGEARERTLPSSGPPHPRRLRLRVMQLQLPLPPADVAPLPKLEADLLVHPDRLESD